MSARPIGRPRSTGTPGALRPTASPELVAYRQELNRSNVRRGFGYTSEELVIVGPFTAPGVWVPFKLSRENRIVKGLSLCELDGPTPILDQTFSSITANDPTARFVTLSELPSMMLRLVDDQGVPYVSDLPALRCLKNGAVQVDGPAKFVVHPMATAMDGGGLVFTDAVHFGLGINWYCPVIFFYQETP